MVSELAKEMLHLNPGEHLCLFYEKDPAEQMPALVPFIQDGFCKNERFIYIADDFTLDELRNHLQQNGIDVEEQTARGRLLLWTRKEWRQPGELDTRAKCAQVGKLIAEARQAGFKGIRFAVEMTWTLEPDIDAGKLEDWEATINTLLDTNFPIRIVCQYNQQRLSPDVLLAGLRTHPRIILGEHVYRNMFYQAPILARDKDSKQKEEQLAWMLQQLFRERKAQLNRDELFELRVLNAESKLREEHARAEESVGRLAAIVESSHDAIVGKDLNGIIHSWNNGAQQLFGYTAEDVIGKSVTILIPPDRQQEEPQILARIRSGERVEPYETVRRCKDGRLVDISLTISPIRDSRGRIVGASKIARDITDKKLGEAERAKWQQELEVRVVRRTAQLSNARKQLEMEIEERKRLESEIARAVEREQERLGQRLHDGLSQDLVGIAFRLSAFGLKLGKDSPGHIDELKQLERMLRESADQTRNLARDVYPVELDSGSLPIALDRLASNTQETYGISCIAQVGKRAREFAPQIAIQLFRIAQEAVHNATKHAHAKQMRIRLARRGASLALTVSDDGVGFGDAEHAKPKGIGLQIMHHRAAMIGGKLRFGNGADRGAVVECVVPDKGS